RSDRDWSSDVCSSDLAAIDLAIELQHFAAESAVELARRGAGDAVTAVDRDFHRAHEAYVGGNSTQIGFADVRMAVPPRAASKLRSEERRVGKGWRTRG